MAPKMFMMLFTLAFCFTSSALHAEEINITIPVNSAVDTTPPTTKPGIVSIQNITFENSAVQVVTDGKLPSFSSFRLAKPARMVIDLPGVTNQLASQNYFNPSAPTYSVKIIPYNDKLRLIIEDPQDQVFPDVTIDSIATGLVIAIKEKSNGSTILTKENNSKLSNDLNHIKPRTSGAVLSQGHVTSVNFEQKPDITRITLNISGNCSIADPQTVINGISISLGDCIVPANWQGNIATVKDHPVINTVTLFPAITSKKVEAGMLIELRQKIKFSFSKEKQRLIVDLETKNNSVTAAAPKSSTQATHTESVKLSVIGDKKNDTKMYGGKKVSMEFDNAELRQIFRLLGEVSGDNIIIGDDVKGNYTIKLKEVPWDQALDMISKNNSLVVIQTGNVVEVISRAKKIERDKLDDEERQKEAQRLNEIELSSQAKEGKLTCTVQLMHAPATRVINQLTSFLTYGAAGDATTARDPSAASYKSKTTGVGATSSTNVNSGQSSSLYADPNTNKLLIQDYRKSVCSVIKLAKKFDIPDKQVMIESRIILANSDFSKSLGVNWDMHYRDGSASLFGINQLDTGFGGLASSPQMTSGAPSAPGVSTGISFGSLASNIQVGMRLQAAESANLVKVVSSPKVVTSYGEPATITQGTQIPYPSTDKNGTVTIEMKDATLELNVTPTITPGCDVLMDVNLKNDSPGAPLVVQGQSTTPIDKRTVKTKITVKNGDTAVIGGVMVTNQSDTDSGVPFLMNVPLLGNLFKSSEKKTIQRELLIFLTPKLLSNSCTDDSVKPVNAHDTKVECLPNDEELDCSDVKLPSIAPYNPPRIYKVL